MSNYSDYQYDEDFIYEQEGLRAQAEAEGLAMQEAQSELAHLEKLLAVRQEDYLIYGKTSSDILKDEEINKRIEELKKVL